MTVPVEYEWLSAQIGRWRRDPVAFVREVLGVEYVEPWQQAALLALGDPTKSPHHSIRSGHGVGKSAFLSWCILWFTVTHFPCKVPCTAPTMHQIEDVLWGELALWRRKMKYGLADMFEVTSDRMYLKAAPDECYAVARTARQENPDALQGFHSENILFLIDEASGVCDEIFQPLEGALSTPGAMSIMCGNPTKCRGYFYDSHHRNRAHFNTVKVSCHDSTRVSPAYIEKMKAQYGEESNVYRVRVLGEFPLEDADVLIPLSIILPARGRDVQVTNCRPVWGCDIARYGECLNALAKRQGNHLLEPVKTWGNTSLMATVGRIVAEYEDTDQNERPHEILVDVCGMGAGVVDRLLELDIPVRGINAGEAPPKRDAKRLSRMRDWLWWQGREWFQRMDCRIPLDEHLMGELSDVHYTLNSSGKITAESKKDMLERGVPSPDRADAFLLTFAGSIVTSDAFEAERKYHRPNKRRRSFMSS